MACADGDCLILGDSIAVGISQLLSYDQTIRCSTVAKVGRSTKQVVAHAPQEMANVSNVVISTGSNDAQPQPELLWSLRKRVSGNVTWILPAKPEAARAYINRIAAERGDHIVDVTQWQLAVDGVHPTMNGYRAVTSAVRNTLTSAVPFRPRGIMVINLQ